MKVVKLSREMEHRQLKEKRNEKRKQDNRKNNRERRLKFNPFLMKCLCVHQYLKE
jgi:hypothetical protein